MAIPTNEPVTGICGANAGGLLAVDAGLRTGLAFYDAGGRLHWYRSHNFGTRERLKRAVAAILDDLPRLGWLVVEGGGILADCWLREAARRNLAAVVTHADRWRPALLIPRHRRNKTAAKDTADILARRVIDWSGAPKPTSLRHDAAEAILVGFWATVECGLRNDYPASIFHP
ncbi:MAG: hypothetical protein JW781_08570 [Deltaproteobacteria bacterium]|nr:hypothetical protein [Candidatus Anaeroferrophillacea bacterium]